MMHMSSPDPSSRCKAPEVIVPGGPVRCAKGTVPSPATCAEQDRRFSSKFLMFTSASIILSALALSLGQYY